MIIPRNVILNFVDYQYAIKEEKTLAFHYIYDTFEVYYKSLFLIKKKYYSFERAYRKDKAVVSIEAKDMYDFLSKLKHDKYHSNENSIDTILNKLESDHNGSDDFSLGVRFTVNEIKQQLLEIKG